MKSSHMGFLTISAMLAMSPAAKAGPYADDLARCLVESTTPDDRTALVKWMFSAAAAHPAVTSLVQVTEQQLDQANRVAAGLFTRLLTDSCKPAVQTALKYEGQVVLQQAFQVLGQVAGQELFTSPEVTRAMAGLERHLDEQDLQQALGTQE